MAYKLTRKAAEDISHIYVEGVTLFGVPQAEKYHADMERKFELISNNPHIARQRLCIGNDGIKNHDEKWYEIL